LLFLLTADAEISTSAETKNKQWSWAMSLRASIKHALTLESALHVSGEVEG
jgi:hypothetical protein